MRPAHGARANETEVPAGFGVQGGDVGVRAMSGGTNRPPCRRL